MDVLKNKSYKNYLYLSRYNTFPYYYHALDNKYVQGLTAYLDDSTPYTLHTVNQGETFDDLALRYYNNPTLYWIICSFNHINDPYMLLHTGDKIKIPSISSIEYRRPRGD